MKIIISEAFAAPLARFSQDCFLISKKLRKNVGIFNYPAEIRHHFRIEAVKVCAKSEENKLIILPNEITCKRNAKPWIFATGKVGKVAFDPAVSLIG